MDFNEFSQQVKEREFPINFPGHWIAGKWERIPGAKKLKGSFNPNNGNQLVEPTTDKKVLQLALDCCDQAQEKMSSLSMSDRIEQIHRMRQALVDFQSISIDAMRLEGGKPTWEASADFDAAIRFLDQVCEQKDSLEASIIAPTQMGNSSGKYSLSPIGPTVAYLPFSTPINSFATYYVGAMIAGCPLILCPSAHATLSGFLYAYLDQSLETIPGSLNVVFGNFDVFKSVISDKRIGAIIYTGSKEHCELIRRESRTALGRSLVLQSGGKNSTLVHSSADLERATQCVMMGAFKSAGQLCTSTSRVFVHKSNREEFCESLINGISKMSIGESDKDENPFMGPLYSEKAVEKFLRYQTMAHREAKDDLLWGKILESEDSKCLVKPGVHLLKHFDKSSGYQSNILFCPDIAIYEYEVLEDAISMINATDAPFVVSFIGDNDIIEKRRSRFLAPNVLVNLPTTEIETSPGLGGRFKCGNHRYDGAGLALLLSYPQVFREAREIQPNSLSSWPW